MDSFDELEDGARPERSGIERISIQSKLPLEYKRIRQNMGIGSWLQPLENLPPSSLPADGVHVRPIGRMAMFMDSAGVANALRAAIQRASANLQGDMLEVILVGSLAGATGSGMLVDLARIVAFAVAEVPHQITLYALNPSPFNLGNDKQRAARFATYREIERFFKIQHTQIDHFVLMDDSYLEDTTPSGSSVSIPTILVSEILTRMKDDEDN